MTRARDLAAFVSNADGDIKFDTDTLYIDSSTDRVGIGTTSPSSILHIEGNTNAYTTSPILYFGSTSTANAAVRDWAIGPADDAYGNFHIFRGTSTGSNPILNDGRVFTISSSGNVGIGDSSPVSNSNYKALTITSTASTGGGQLYVKSSSVTGVFGADNTTDAKTIVQTNTNHPLAFGTNGSERMRILAAGGLTFNGDTAAANALNDYEEGTWTPAYTFHSGGTVTHGARGGNYIKIGNFVLIGFNLRSTAVSGVSGSLKLTGLPFPVKDATGARMGGSIGFNRNWGADMPNFRIYTHPGQSELLFYHNAMNTGTSQSGTSQFSTGNDSNVIEGSVAYITE